MCLLRDLKDFCLACGMMAFIAILRWELGAENMGIESILVIIIIGAIAGWLAGQLIRGFGFGLLGNIVVGVLGAFVAGLIFPVIGLGFGGGLIGSIIHATLGAVILLFLIRLVKRV
ncbi:MAG TPA: GlsB/YeaQ/YmgE family stress response membrane protein [Yoonia sp.]|nr:GlsB/YeaQ/YmgE family stress response membrane protein [Yoonia sp.]